MKQRTLPCLALAALVIVAANAAGFNAYGKAETATNLIQSVEGAEVRVMHEGPGTLWLGDLGGLTGTVRITEIDYESIEARASCMHNGAEDKDQTTEWKYEFVLDIAPVVFTGQGMSSFETKLIDQEDGSTLVVESEVTEFNLDFLEFHATRSFQPSYGNIPTPISHSDDNYELRAGAGVVDGSFAWGAGIDLEETVQSVGNMLTRIMASVGEGSLPWGVFLPDGTPDPSWVDETASQLLSTEGGVITFDGDAAGLYAVAKQASAYSC